MNNENQQKPCLVQTGQGFSVNYKGKFLYSKYNPAKAILQKIESLEILSGSVILCMSPVVGYGLAELKKKLPESCAVLLCERDESLRELTENCVCSLGGNVENDGGLVPSGCRLGEDFAFLTVEELYNLPVILQKSNYTFNCGYSLGDLGTYRRVIRIDFSAGVQFYADFYSELENACVNSVKQFWTNRITLSKFGRRFSRNIFRNLKTLPKSTPIAKYIGKISKPIVVFGAGETSEIGAKTLLSGDLLTAETFSQFGDTKKLSRDDFFVLCADTAFPMLKGYGIVPDGIVIDEAQSVIAESFIGADRCNVQIFQSLCSVPHVAGRFFPLERISFYATDYASSSVSDGFFDDLKSRDFFPPVVPPFGSVGITAYFLANLFKSSDAVPVTVYGLDFAYSAGKTHANGTPAQKRQFREANRIKPVGNYGACFGANAVKITGEKIIYSSPILRTYAETFNQVKRNIKKLTEDVLADDGEKLTVDIAPREVSESERDKEFFKKLVLQYLENEREKLEELRDILSGKTEISSDKRDLKIREICQPREYLYLHFPDGYKFSMSLDFLKRIRVEIDFFLKYM